MVVRPGQFDISFSGGNERKERKKKKEGGKGGKVGPFSISFFILILKKTMGQVSPFKDGGEHASLVNVVSNNAPFYYRKAFQVKICNEYKDSSRVSFSTFIPRKQTSL